MTPMPGPHGRVTTIEPVPATSSSVPSRTVDGRAWLTKVFRYLSGSVVATVCSEVAFVVMYGPLHVRPGWSSFVGWLAGAIPNYWLNRSWTWRRTGRPGFRDEVLPYVVIIGVTLLLATVVTREVDHALSGTDWPGAVRVGVVAAAFLGVYVVMFVLRFFLLERLFSRLAAAESGQQTRSEGPS